MVLTGSAAADGIVVFCQQSFVPLFFFPKLLLYKSRNLNFCERLVNATQIWFALRMKLVMLIRFPLPPHGYDVIRRYKPRL